MLLYSSLMPIFFATVFVISFSAQRYFSPLVMRAVLWYVGFLLLSGLLYFATLQLLVPGTSLINALPGIVGAYIIAWLLGAITPGAPAGIGVLARQFESVRPLTG